MLLLSTLSLTPVSAEAGDPVIRINAGGVDYTDTAGQLWSADTGFNTGQTSSTSNSISATDEDFLFQSHRWNPSDNPELAYTFAVPDGDYQVKLYFAETNSWLSKVGGRAFDVFLENQLVLDNLDVYAEVGANAALIETFTVSVSDGQLNLDFAHKVQNPIISAIEILKQEKPRPDNDTALRINAGGADYTDTAGQLWSADTGFNTGQTSSTSNSISATDEDFLFQSHRWDPAAEAELAYSFAVPDGDYQVKLYFAETNSWLSKVGGRAFDVFLENQLVLDNLDVYAEVGANAALIETFTVSVSDGQLNLDFAHKVQNPIISAIEILKQEKPRPDNDTALRINAGGADYTDTAGQLWSADTGFNTGQTSSTSNSISATDEDFLFQSHRWDPAAEAELAYSFAVPDGDYQVKLYFAETNSWLSKVGGRAFDVFLENQLVLDNLDVYAEVGANAALIETFTVSVSDGQLNLDFAHKVQNPIISAIEILATSISVIKPDHGTVTINGDTTVKIDMEAGTGSVVILDVPSYGNASVMADNTILYTPDSGYVGQDTLTYRVTDSNGNVTIANLNIKVGCTNCLPEEHVTLSWTPAMGEVSGYRIYSGFTTDTATQFFSDLHIASGEVNADSPSVTYRAGADLGMSNGETVCFAVTAYNESGESSSSEPICGTI